MWKVSYSYRHSPQKMCDVRMRAVRLLNGKKTATANKIGGRARLSSGSLTKLKPHNQADSNQTIAL